MATLRLNANMASYSPQNAYTDLHKLLLQVKISHYVTKSFAAHSALGETYDDVNDLIDTITEKLIGYSGIDPQPFQIGTISPMEPSPLGTMIMGIAKKLEDYAEKIEYCDIENLAQELSGVGAQLIYLSRFK